LGTCSGLCEQLSNNLEATICSLICDYVGITEFVNVLDDIDPDPIFYCEELDLCPVALHAKGKITSVVVQPPFGPSGTTFNIQISYQITNATGTSTLEVDVYPPSSDGGSPFGDAELLGSLPVGKYSADFQLTASPSEQEPFSPGIYKTNILLCEGTCNSIHSYAYTLDSKATQFQITS